MNIEEHYIKTYSSIDARRSDLLRLVEENPDRVDFLHELQVHVEVLFDMTERNLSWSEHQLESRSKK